MFALIELMRGVTAFLFGPVLLYLVGIFSPDTTAGISDAVWICFGICVGGVLLALYVFVAGGARLQTPDLERWQDEGEPAWHSPPLFDVLRPPSREQARRGPAPRPAPRR